MDILSKDELKTLMEKSKGPCVQFLCLRTGQEQNPSKI